MAEKEKGATPFESAPQAKTTDRNSTASALVKLLGEVAR